MLRVIVRETNVGAAVNVGGPVDSRFKTFDIDVPALDRYLREIIGDSYLGREVVGVELLPTEESR